MNYSEIPSPCFVIEEQKLIDNLVILRKVEQSANVNIIAALKGFSFWHYFPLIREYISGACASSLNEVRLIYEEMHDKAYVYSPAYIDEDFKDILVRSHHITFNSLNQWERYKNVMKANKDVKAGLRVNPEYSEIETDIYNPAAPGSRLGITIDKMPEKLPSGISGLHFHLLCEQDSFVFERVLEKFEEKFSSYLDQIEWLNVGGGHHITRNDYDVNHLISVLKNFKSRHPNIQIVLEPGEAVGWQTGFLKSSILDIVENNNVKTAILDVSFSAHMPDTLEMPYKPTIRNAGNMNEYKFNYRMGGSTCLAGDFMGDYSFSKELKIGESLFFEDMIHYTMVKTTLFNGVKHPNIGKIDRSGNFTLLRKICYDDYKRRLS